ncbi:MAG: DinB family protein [Candidatus Obscuribacterales bacterium]|nr:DinB family protein [Candidatus Obscuribacterales bacterium]
MTNPTATIAHNPKLEKPGAGLPFFEWFVAKFFIVPSRLRASTVVSSIEQFKSESAKIIDLAKSVPPELLHERRLIPRLRGLEDSSRFWSVAMTLQHLVIVGNGMTAIIKALSEGKTNLPRRGTADVKPSPEVNAAEIISQFEEMVTNLVATVEKLDFKAHPHNKHPHPWFGPFSATQWLAFAAPHTAIHKHQIREIISRLS